MQRLSLVYNLSDQDAQGIVIATNLENSSATGAGCVVPHGDVVRYHLSARGDVDPTSILSSVAQHFSVGKGQLTGVVSGHTTSLCPLVQAALGVVQVQGRSICTMRTAAVRVQPLGAETPKLR